MERILVLPEPSSEAVARRSFCRPLRPEGLWDVGAGVTREECIVFMIKASFRPAGRNRAPSGIMSDTSDIEGVVVCGLLAWQDEGRTGQVLLLKAKLQACSN